MSELLRISFDMQRVEALLRDAPRSAVGPATVRALNKTAANVRTAASSAIRKKRALSAKVVREAISIRKATSANLVATVVATGRPIPLRDYAARESKRKGVTVAVTPGARKPVAHNGNKAFIVHKIGGHVFARQGKERLPIKKLYGPSLPATFVQDEVKQTWMAVAQESLPRRLGEELHYELLKLAR